MYTENKITKAKNVLLALETTQAPSAELQYVIHNFCGTVVEVVSEITEDHENIYVCGDLSSLVDFEHSFYVIEEASYNYEQLSTEKITFIPLGKVPVILHNAGVYFRNFFTAFDDYFHRIKTEHAFQHLTESNKQSNALRKGIYLSEVVKEENDQLRFNLLRCSSNLSGPTDNFRTTDQQIIKALNTAAASVFEEKTSLNHVLAQIYENRKDADERAKERKAKIKAHSDKTKDMDKRGLIAFCTFYDHTQFEQLKPSKTDLYDWVYGKSSGLTKLHFKLKKSVTDETLEKEFSVTLYPNSVFIIPLSTNRLYTHEIRPSHLNVDRIPTRMGYVVRCSNLEAVFMNNETYIKENGDLIKLEEMTRETMSELRTTYYEENVSEQKVAYGKVHFSMNAGDYQKPIY
jgi:hypothetical protein